MPTNTRETLQESKGNKESQELEESRIRGNTGTLWNLTFQSRQVVILNYSTNIVQKDSLR